MNEFEQSRWFVKIRSRIDPDGVWISERGPLSRYETKHPYHQIPDDIVRASNVPRLLLVATVFFGLSFFYRTYLFATDASDVTLETLGWSGFIFAMFGLSLWARSARLVGYVCGTGNLLFFDKKGKQNPEPFLARIHAVKIEYFRQYYEHQAAASQSSSRSTETSTDKEGHRLN